MAFHQLGNPEALWMSSMESPVWSWDVGMGRVRYWFCRAGLVRNLMEFVTFFKDEGKNRNHE